MFSGVTVTLGDGDEAKQETVDTMSDAEFAELGRSNPALMKALLANREAADPGAWRDFQAGVQTLKLQRQRFQGQAAEVRALLDEAQRYASKRQGLGLVDLPGKPCRPEGFRSRRYHGAHWFQFIVRGHCFLRLKPRK
jgi:hypothetical protein